ITSYPWGSAGQGIVHVIGPEMGYTQPGMTIVCGDSHTSTHGAFGALAFGIGTSEVEHVLATQTLPQAKPKWMSVAVDGELPPDCVAKDVILAVFAAIGTGGGVGGRTSLHVHGAPARNGDPRHPAGHDLHRVLHELSHRGPPHRGGRGPRAHRHGRPPSARRPGQRRREAPGGAGGPGPDLRG